MGTKLDQKSSKKWVKKGRHLGIDFSSILEAKVKPSWEGKSIKKAMQNMMQVGLEFGALLGRIWLDDGKQPPAD